MAAMAPAKPPAADQSAAARAQTPGTPIGAGMMGAMMRGMGGGMAGGMGGGMAGGMGGGSAPRFEMAPEAVNRRLRASIASTAAQLESGEENSPNEAVHKWLQTPISMKFAQGISLEDVLSNIKNAKTLANASSIPIYVDPEGLQKAQVTLQSPVSIDLEGVPLKTSLRLILKQLDLAYCVRGGVLIISSVPGIADELNEELSEQEGKRQGVGSGLE